ncbi:hypothetical protein DVH24_032117 [Malus domestica]|uniref:Uncharacterized protein n=1 Tax=Malus domestica TaxID=3750 RepID=A0A498J2P9_MALDO|nr:hypothetical protein DVH24_032117 [Malus domestica]
MFPIADGDHSGKLVAAVAADDGKVEVGRLGGRRWVGEDGLEQRQESQRSCVTEVRRGSYKRIRLISIAGFSGDVMMLGLDRLVVNLKSKLRSLKVSKKPYDKIEKSESMRVEIRSKKARKLIEKTLKVSDSSKSKTFAF